MLKRLYCLLFGHRLWGACDPQWMTFKHDGAGYIRVSGNIKGEITPYEP